ncbi:MAG: hypothetical protein ACOZBZ_03145 [Patescibacteria group bacterium]
MSEQANPSVENPMGVEGTALEPIGDVILGKVDPKTLTKEEFAKSPDVLFHGAAKPFNYSPQYDYNSPEYYTEADGSQTIGQGFYTTNNREAAINYSSVRQLGEKKEPVVLTLLPYQAKVLDLRAKNDNTRNASIPRTLFEKWRKFFTDYYHSSSRQNLPWYITSNEAEYLLYLARVSKLDQVDLRIMLETAPKAEVKSRNLPSPPWTNLFSNFMKQEGYDGLVYIEGGEDQSRKGHASFVFYNLEKIGTYESWHNSTK